MEGIEENINKFYYLRTLFLLFSLDNGEVVEVESLVELLNQVDILRKSLEI
ncbi:hypothetical protein [Bacillus cereus]|uniref:hypothetical protein n=1 Tax=Bacillus cereus TaxID=1396 RepID=UPI0015CF0AB1|nr:hypothetical protein [Bacillus cereus]